MVFAGASASTQRAKSLKSTDLFHSKGVARRGLLTPKCEWRRTDVTSARRSWCALGFGVLVLVTLRPAVPVAVAVLGAVGGVAVLGGVAVVVVRPALGPNAVEHKGGVLQAVLLQQIFEVLDAAA